MSKDRAQAVIVQGFFGPYAKQIVEIAKVLYERAAIYVDKIPKGTNPASLPVEQPSKFQVTVNNKTAVCTENLSSGVVVVKSAKDGV